jgi:exodeoxyribonuclease VII small subunit
MTTRKQDRGGEEARGKEIGFERALERLEKIVSEMEGGKLPLEDMIARFEEGQALMRVCTRKLNEVERRIEMLVKKGEETVAVPFAPDADAEGDPAGEAEAAGADEAKRDGDLF